MADAAISLEDGIYSVERELTYESLTGKTYGMGKPWSREEIEYQVGTLADRPLVVRIDAPLDAKIGTDTRLAKALGTLAKKVEQKVGAPVELCEGARECVETCKRQVGESCCKWRCKK